jgi:hypothetical protein
VIFLFAVFENMVLRRIFGLERDELTGGCRKLHSEELHKFYSSQNVIGMIKEDEMGRACSMMEKRNVCRIMVDNIKIDLKKIEWGGLY